MHEMQRSSLENMAFENNLYYHMWLHVEEEKLQYFYFFISRNIF